MGRTLVIAEPGMTWDRKLDDAYRLIDAAKACGADVCKFQWTSNGRKIQERRKVDPKYIAIYEHGVQYPREWLELLKARCDSVGIEFMATTYLIEDIAVVAPLVKRFKVSAFESGWPAFLQAHHPFLKAGSHKEVIVSKNAETPIYNSGPAYPRLLCVSKYPTDISELGLSRLHGTLSIPGYHGLSDHTTSLISGAVAVGAGATIVEKHIRLWTTHQENPDYDHSLIADDECRDDWAIPHFAQYVRNIREAEVML